MTPDDRYFFDINGYVVVEDVLSPDELHRLNAAIDAKKLPVPQADDPHKQRFGGYLQWDEPLFRALLDHPRVLPYLRAILGEGFRLDHDYGIYMDPGNVGLNLHGGGMPYDPAQYYHVQNERVYCGLVVVSWALCDVGPGDGGFCCIPGSHKANFPLPPDVRNYKAHQDWIKHVPQKAGSFLLFTEALTHGTLPWTATHQRRSLLYKYCPGHMSWGHHPRTEEFLAPLTPQQQRLFEPPHVYRRAKIVEG